jgi:hypothetical protein
VFKNRVLRGIFGPKGKEAGENYIMRSFITYAFRWKLLGCSNHGRDGQSMQNAWKRWGNRLGRPMCKCDIKLDLKGMEWEGVDWINLLQDGDQ